MIKSSGSSDELSKASQWRQYLDEHCLQHVRGGAVILEIRKWRRHPRRHQGKHSHRQVVAWSRNGIGQLAQPKKEAYR